jgi:hypothetical protein
MEPISPVIPGLQDIEILIAKDQEQYRPLPAIICQDGTVVSHWKLSWRERWIVFLTGSLWLQQLSFHQPLQPQLPTVEPPEIKRVEV